MSKALSRKSLVLALMLLVVSIFSERTSAEEPQLDQLRSEMTKSSAGAAQPEVLLWSFLNPYVGGVKTIPTNFTDNGEFSNVVQADLAPGTNVPFFVKLVFALAVDQLRNPTALPQKLCNGDQASINTCCLQNSTSTCLPQMNWSHCENSICLGLAKISFVNALGGYVAKEVATRSKEMIPNELKGNLPGGKNLFVWPLLVKDKNTLLVTNVDSELIAILNRLFQTTSPVVRLLINSPYFQSDAFVCDASGISPISWPADLSDSVMLDVSPGISIPAIKHLDDTGERYVTMTFASKTGRTHMRVAVVNSVSVGGANKQLVDYLDAMVGQSDWFSCLSIDMNKTMPTLKNLLNNEKTAVAFFGFILLRSFINDAIVVN